MLELNFEDVTPAELEGEQHYGPSEDDLERGVIARVNESPICIPIADIFTKLGHVVDNAFNRQFRAWLVPHMISIHRRTGFAQVTAVGCEIEYETTGSCSVISLIPQPQFIDLAKGAVNFDGAVKGSIDASGNLSTDYTQTAVDAPEFKWGANSELTFTGSGKGEASIGVQFEAHICSPFIAASGVGGRHCEFRFDLHKEPLFGRDISTWSILALSKHKRKLSYRIRYFYIMRTAFVPKLRASPWQTIECTLLT